MLVQSGILFPPGLHTHLFSKLPFCLLSSWPCKYWTFSQSFCLTSEWLAFVLPVNGWNKSQHPCLFDGIHHRSGWVTFQSYLHLCLASSWPYPASLISLQVSSEITTSINQFYKNLHVRLFLGNLNWNTFHQFFSLINFSRSFGPLSLILKLVKHTFSLSRHQW